MGTKIEQIVVEGHLINGKLCTGPCHTILPLGHFGKDKRLSTGYRSWCKKCERRKQIGYKTNYDFNRCHTERSTDERKLEVLP